jgi:hypothetical protein
METEDQAPETELTKSDHIFIIATSIGILVLFLICGILIKAVLPPF